MKNNGNYKKKYDIVLEEFDKLRRAYERESGQLWFGQYEYPVGQSEYVVNKFEDANKIMNGDIL